MCRYVCISSYGYGPHVILDNELLGVFELSIIQLQGRNEYSLLVVRNTGPLVSYLHALLLVLVRTVSEDGKIGTYVLIATVL